MEGKGEITQRDLVRNSLRMHPDRIVVGEVRGAEVIDSCCQEGRITLGKNLACRPVFHLYRGRHAKRAGQGNRL